MSTLQKFEKSEYYEKLLRREILLLREITNSKTIMDASNELVPLLIHFPHC